MSSVSCKSAKLVRGLVAGTGIVALGAVVASGAAVGALVEGFKAAGKAVRDALDETEENAKQCADTTEKTDESQCAEVVVEEEEAVEPDEERSEKE